MNKLMVVSLALVTALVFGDFILPSSSGTYYISSFSMMNDDVANYLDLSVDHSSIFSFEDPSYIQIGWYPNFDSYHYEEETAAGTFVESEEHNINNLLDFALKIRYRLSEKSYANAYLYYKNYLYLDHKISDTDMNGKNTESFEYRGDSNDISAGVEYAQDLGFLKLSLGAFYSYHSSHPDYTMEVNEDGTKTYSISGYRWWRLPSASGTSFGHGNSETSYGAKLSFYIDGIRLWGRDLRYEIFDNETVWYVTPYSTMDPQIFSEYYNVDLKYGWSGSEYSGTVGIDLSFGKFELSPSIYFRNETIQHQEYYHEDTDDKSMYLWENTLLGIEPIVEIYCQPLDMKLGLAYRYETAESLSHSLTRDGSVVSWGASDIAYTGYREMENTVIASVEKKLSLFGLESALGVWINYSFADVEPLAYDKDKNPVEGYDVIYHSYYPNRFNLNSELVLSKSFENGKVKIGAVLSGGFSFSNYARIEYDWSEDKLKYYSRNSVNWYFKPFSKVFLDYKALENLNIVISAWINDYSQDNYPYRWSDSGEYVDENNSITKSNRLLGWIRLHVRYQF